MKPFAKVLNAFIFTCTFMFASVLLFAQDKKIDVDLNVNKGGNWYSNPVVWVIGGAVFILLLVALLRNNRSGK